MNSPLVPALSVFLFVLALRIWFVGRLASETPWGDSWPVDGAQLFPAWVRGTLDVSDIFRAHNEHRIAWTRLLDLGLFVAGGQWDPLAQQFAGALVRAAAAALVAYQLCRSSRRFAAAVVVAYLPFLAWHNVIWGFQSQVFFSLGFGALAIGLWTSSNGGLARKAGGLLAAVASMFAMGSGYLLPAAWLFLVALRAWQRRAWRQSILEIAGIVVLVALSQALRVNVPEHDVLRSDSLVVWGSALLTGLSWPHVHLPAAAVVMNIPITAGVVLAIRRDARAATGEAQAALGFGVWAVMIIAAAAYSRGASAEFFAAIPSRYVDFVVLLVLANGWWAYHLVRGSPANRRSFCAALAAGWTIFVLAGLAALMVPVWRGLVVPRLQDRDVAVRVLQDYQRGRDAAVFEGRPKLQTPGVGLDLVDQILRDPALTGKLPPALQVDQPVGAVGRSVRWIRMRVDVIAVLLSAAALVLGFLPFPRGPGWRGLRSDPSTRV